MTDGPENRQAKRKAVGLLVKLGHQGVDDFVAKYATNLSEGGMFIRSKKPLPIHRVAEILDLVVVSPIMQANGFIPPAS